MLALDPDRVARRPFSQHPAQHAGKTARVDPLGGLLELLERPLHLKSTSTRPGCGSSGFHFASTCERLGVGQEDLLLLVDLAVAAEVALVEPERGPSSRSCRPVSSRSSRAAAASRLSPSLRPPPGVAHQTRPTRRVDCAGRGAHAGRGRAGPPGRRPLGSRSGRRRRLGPAPGQVTRHQRAHEQQRQPDIDDGEQLVGHVGVSAVRLIGAKKQPSQFGLFVKVTQ